MEIDDYRLFRSILVKLPIKNLRIWAKYTSLAVKSLQSEAV